MSPIIIFIEGNIGSGKTTFLQNLTTTNYNYQILYEPVDKWIKEGMLDRFYSDPYLYSYDFQLYCLKTRYELFSQIDITKDYIFIERSPFCDENVFAENCLRQQTNKLNQYKDVWNNYMEEKYISDYNYPYHFLYIDENYENCYEHIKQRGRNQENKISLEYLETLQHLHTNWFNNYNEILFDNFTFHKKNNTSYIKVKNYDIRKKDNVNLIIDKVIQYINKGFI